MSCAGKKEDSKMDIPVVQEEASGPSPYPINDEFGVPMLELSSDSDTVRIHSFSNFMLFKDKPHSFRK